jgi:hypothetical protein
MDQDKLVATVCDAAHLRRCRGERVKKRSTAWSEMKER